MAHKTLAHYVKEQIDKGYDVNTIKHHLIKYGYSIVEINKAINKSYRTTEVRHIIHFSPATMVTLLSVFLGLVIFSSIFFFVAKEKTPAQLLDIELESVATTAKQGSEISFITELTSVGSKKRYDVNLRHEIISQKTSKTLTFKEETKAIETSTSLKTSIAIPDEALPGDYILRTIATYNGQRAVATLPVKIEKSDLTEPSEEPLDEPLEEQPEEPLDEPLEEQPEEPLDEPSEEPPEEPPVTGPIDVGGLSSFEALEKVRNLAKQDPADAVSYCPKFEFQTSRDLCYEYVGEESADKKYCEKIQGERTKDICYANVAKNLFNPELCEEIKKDNRRDSCYMSFVTEEKKDFSVCDKVVNEYLKQSCNSLKQLSEIDAEQLSFYLGLINESLRLALYNDLEINESLV